MDATAIVVAAYREIGVALDRLPYTGQMDRLVTLARSRGMSDLTPRQAWLILSRERKDRRLPRIGRGQNNRLSLPPRDTVRRCHSIIGTPIDQLPYSDDMEKLIMMVREAAPGFISPWQV